MKKRKDGIDVLLAYYEEHMPETSLLIKNQTRYDEVKEAAQCIIDFVKETDNNAIINMSTDDITGSSICLEITASLIVIDMVDKFCDALRVADNFEVCPKADGSIMLGIVFERMYNTAEPKK